MNFANVKNITIPEGEVTKITVAGVVLWEKKSNTTAALGTAVLGKMVLGEGDASSQLGAFVLGTSKL